MPLLKGTKDGKKPEWVQLPNTRKQVTKQENFVLGHPEVKLPAIVSSSNMKGIKARIVTVKSVEFKGPPSVNTSHVNVIHEWEFDQDDQTKPVYFNPPITVNHDCWVEMCNPTKQDAVVNAVVQGLYMSKNL